MEKETVTIEIKQDVSIMLLWIVAGVLVVSLVFLLAPSADDLWSSLNAAGIAGALYFIVMLAYALRKPVETRTRIWIGTAACVVLALGAFTWIRAQDQVEWQAETLVRIRGVIGRGVMRNDMSGAALRTLDRFYQQRGSKKESLANVFRTLNAGAEVGANIHKPEWDGDLRQVIVARLEPQIVEFVSQETYVKGRNPEFINFNGQSGMIQERFIVTEKGITHVSEN